ncbi:MAG: hypothetical protein MUP18_05460, partial [Desulfobacterales bacterium]|nr:hypothetical protein [Desulfobacterales bacterium]
SEIILILRRRQTPAFRMGSKAPLSINPEQTPGFRPGIVEGLISVKSVGLTREHPLAVLSFGHHEFPKY